MNDDKEVQIAGVVALTSEIGKNVSEPFVELLTPPCKAIGTGISSVLNLAFLGFNFLNKKFQVAMDKYFKESAEEINKIPEDKLHQPPLNKIGPILEASKYYVENEVLRNMFAKLLASTCNLDTSNLSHISFVEILKQLSVEEANILSELQQNMDVYPAADFTYQNEKGTNVFQETNFIPLNLDENYTRYNLYAFLDNLQR